MTGFRSELSKCLIDKKRTYAGSRETACCLRLGAARVVPLGATLSFVIPVKTRLRP